MMISWDVWDSLRAYVVLLSLELGVGVDDHTPPLIRGLMAHMVSYGRYELLLRQGLAHLINPVFMRLCDVLM